MQALEHGFKIFVNFTNYRTGVYIALHGSYKKLCVEME